MAKVAERLPSNLWLGLPVAHTQRKINPSTPPPPPLRVNDADGQT